jgi:hypothetical protein
MPVPPSRSRFVLVLGAFAAFAFAACARVELAGIPDVTRSSMSFDRELARADGTERIVVRVTVRDARGAPLPGARVEVDAVCPDVLLRQPGITGADGSGLIEARAVSPGRYRLVAKVVVGRRSLLLDRGDVLTFVPASHGERVDALPFGRMP